jgi:hypothetical protein
MNYNEKMNAMICTLRMQIAKLQKELEKYSREYLFDFKTRYTAEVGLLSNILIFN